MALDMDFSKLKPQDVLDLAMFAEEEAEEQYGRLATAMDAARNSDVAEFFRKMASREKRHCEQISERRQALYHDAKPNLANRAVWGVEAPYDAKIDASMAIGDAFAIALASEQRAHDFYASALQFLTEPDVSKLFEDLRLAEMEHKRMLEIERSKRSA
jgi:rubrerythrin